jgi:peptide/nickel transport system permease protein
MAMLSFGILCLYGAIGFLDTLHFRRVSWKPPTAGISKAFSMCSALPNRAQKNLLVPFAVHLFTKENMITPEGKQIRAYPRLRFAGDSLQDPSESWSDIRIKVWPVSSGVLASVCCCC